MATSVPLEIQTGNGWLVGFGNMVGKEWGSWWRTRRALVHLCLWLFVINGLLFLVGVDERQGHAPPAVLSELIAVFLRAGGLFATIGIIVATQSSIVGEKQLGTAEWVLSKPVSRSAFLLSKFLVDGVSFVFLAVVVPTVVFYLQSIHHALMQPAVVPFLTGVLLHVQHLVFYLALTLVAGTFFSGRGAVTGVAIGFLVAGLILPSAIPSITPFLPWALHVVAAGVAMEGTMPPDAWTPIVLTTLWTLLCLLVALWRFEREEL